LIDFIMMMMPTGRPRGHKSTALLAIWPPLKLRWWVNFHSWPLPGRLVMRLWRPWLSLRSALSNLPGTIKIGQVKFA